MKQLLFTFFLLPLLVFSQNRPEFVGDIKFDEKTDKRDFYLCNEGDIFQYFNNSEGVEYNGEKYAIEKEFSDKYHSENVKKENALVRIRFVVNCKGETDRFRTLVADYNYQPIKIDENITSQLLEITKNLKGWKPKTYRGIKIDYYQYLIFKIKDGKIDEILP